jgi:hypothetical protein
MIFFILKCCLISLKECFLMIFYGDFVSIIAGFWCVFVLEVEVEIWV